MEIGISRLSRRKSSTKTHGLNQYSSLNNLYLINFYFNILNSFPKLRTKNAPIVSEREPLIV